MPKQYSLLRIFSLCFVLSIAAPSLSTNEIEINSIDAQVITTLDPDTLSMEGNVVIKTEQLEFWSDKAVYNKSQKTITLEGSIRVLSKNLEISAQEMEANLLDRTFYITETSFTFMKKSFGGADSIRVYANEKVELLNTSINSCSLEDPVWVDLGCLLWRYYDNSASSQERCPFLSI